MFRRGLISIFLIFGLCFTTFAQSDTTVLDTKLTEYLTAIERETATVKCGEADFLISSCTDSTIRQRVANQIYNHFLESKLMGDEAVAIHVFDRWFADGTVKMPSDAEFYAADFHARLNRPTLIGNKAPALELQNESGEPVSLFGEAGRRYSILYFYDIYCSKCLVESILLRNLLEATDYPVDLYAIYVGSEGDKWELYREERFGISADKPRVYHLWDPDLTSDFIMKYGVISTPKMLLVDAKSIIVGRDLDTEALGRLLAAIMAPRELEYGGKDAMEMYSTVFSSPEELDCGSVPKVAEHLSESLLSAGDTLMYKQMTGDLLYFLTNRKESAFKCGTEAFVDKYILDTEGIWTTADDSLKVVNLASFLKRLTQLCPVGSALPDIEVPATIVKRNGKTKVKTVNLSSARRSAVMFHTEGCPLCRAEREAADSLIASGSADFKSLILIDMDEIWSMTGSLAEDLMGTFDLSSLPFILTTDGKARVKHKYVTFR